MRRTALPLRLLVGVALVTACHADPPAGRTWGLDAYLAERSSEADVRVVQLAAGDLHSCALRSDGKVVCWGSNGRRQIADTDQEAVVVPRPIAGIERTVSIAANGHRTCAVSADGKIACWGDREGPPVLVDRVSSPATSVALGAQDACALLRDGTVQCWNDAGAHKVELEEVRQLVAGDHHFCAALEDGTVSCWGKNDQGQLGNGSRVATDEPSSTQIDGVMALQAQGDGTCAWTWEASVFCWGGIAGFATDVPIGVPFTDGAMGAAYADREQRMCGWFDNGRVRCVGEDRSIEEKRDLSDVVQIVAGVAHFCALRREGEVDCWGDGAVGQTADAGEIRATAERAELRDVRAIAADDDKTCFLSTDAIDCRKGGAALVPATTLKWPELAGIEPTTIVVREVEVCARGRVSALCGPTDGSAAPRLIQIPADDGSSLGLVDLELSPGEACAVTSDRRGRCWTRGTTGPRSVDVAPLPDLPPLKDIVIDGTIFALTTWGELWKLDGRTSSASKRIEGAPPAEEVVSRHGITCLRTKTGEVWCGTPTRAMAAVAGIAAAQSLVVSRNLGCAVVASGDVFCFGADNAWGQRGDGTTEAGPSPSRVKGVAKAKAVALGRRHGCALSDDAEVRCWGRAQKVSEISALGLTWRERPLRVAGLLPTAVIHRP